MNFATPRCWCCFVSNEPFSDGVVFSGFFRIHDVETCIPIIANFLIWHCKTGRANVKNARFQELRWFRSFIFLPSCINSTYSSQFSGAWWRAMNMLRTQCWAKKWQQIGAEYCQFNCLKAWNYTPETRRMDTKQWLFPTHVRYPFVQFPEWILMYMG